MLTAIAAITSAAEGNAGNTYPWQLFYIEKMQGGVGLQPTLPFSFHNPIYSMYSMSEF
jgi:hypothetical protein